ncbi:MAG TPA: adenine deaminase [Dehalococcoidia bacterium]|nr:adenine deaminase [Dehalococcoidia bacterium]
MTARQAKLIAAARGDRPADLILANGKVVNTFTGEVTSGNVAICGDRIAGVGDYREARQTIDVSGRYLAPGFIDGHVHLESSMLDVGQYVQAVVPRGTSAIVTDLHEIANVCGLDGMRYVLDCVRKLPLDLFLMAPSCVPATHLETSGAAISPEEVRQILRWRETIGLGEVMNFPGVIHGEDTVLRKIALSRGKIIDGHAPGVRGKDLNAYIAAGIGSDHESVTLEEAKEKLEKGMHVMIREGSAEKNLEALLPLVTDKTYKRCLFVVDDRSAYDLLHDGDIDAVVRKAIRLGLEPVRAIQLATINAAGYFCLDSLGAIAPGYFANILLLDDLDNLSVHTVFYRGRPVAREGKPLFSLPQVDNRAVTGTINIKPFDAGKLRLMATSEELPVIEVVPGQIVTRKRYLKVKTVNGQVIPDTERDILKLAVAERHRATGHIGLGMVVGFGLKKGALASSVAHDSHNIVAVGTSDEDILMAIREIERLQGGLAAVAEGKVLASLGLSIAGLLSAEPLENVVAQLGKLDQAARELGARIPSPFATLSFLALPVIPELKLTDRGLVDVNEFRLIS